MSLDVYLRVKRAEKPDALKACELLRQNGFDDLAFEIECRHDCGEYECLYSANITHNLNVMAVAAGIYQHLWRPDEIGIAKASELIAPLNAGLKWLRDNRAEAEKHNSPNGWGMYEHFVPFVQKYVQACEEYPNAEVEVSR